MNWISTNWKLNFLTKSKQFKITETKKSQSQGQKFANYKAEKPKSTNCKISIAYVIPHISSTKIFKRDHGLPQGIVEASEGLTRWQ